jgi:hypothetical protein
MFRLFAPKWHRDREKLRRERLSPQFKKAWLAGFPSELWPSEEEEAEDGIYLRLKDGTRLLAQEFNLSTNRAGASTASSLNPNPGLGTWDEMETWEPEHS